jgi:hypothetical protein
MSYCIIFLVLLLQFECDVDADGKFEGGIMVVYEPSIFEESEISEAEDFGWSFLLLLNLDVLTQTHGKEERQGWWVARLHTGALSIFFWQFQQWRMWCPKAGDMVCHWGVDFSFMAIEADGCPKAGDLSCHWGVDFCFIRADGCPKAGDLSCHWGVDFCSIGADGCPDAGDLVCHSGVDSFFVGADERSSLGGDLVVEMSSLVRLWSIGMSLLIVQIM